MTSLTLAVLAVVFSVLYGTGGETDDPVRGLLNLVYWVLTMALAIAALVALVFT